MSADARVNEFLLLYGRHEARLRGLAFSLLPRWVDAEDVLQEANLVMWKRFDQFQPGSNFFAWAARIVQLKVKEFRRRTVHRELALGFLTEEVVEKLVQQSESMSFELTDRYAALDECLQQLTPEQRELLQLRYASGGTVAGVAAALDRSIEAIYKATARLRQTLSDCVNRKLAAIQR